MGSRHLYFNFIIRKYILSGKDFGRIGVAKTKIKISVNKLKKEME